ncbi:Protease Do-like 7 [Fagus crenata]
MFSKNVATVDDWMKALNKCVPAVVVLNSKAWCDFDIESIKASYSTGFVFDKRHDIVSLNRDVVTKLELVVAEALSVNRVEIPGV